MEYYLLTLRVCILSLLIVSSAFAEVNLRGTLETNGRPQDLTIELRPTSGGAIDILTAFPALNGQFDFAGLNVATYLLSVKNQKGEILKEERVHVSGPHTEITIRLSEKVEQGHGTVSAKSMNHRTPKAAQQALKRSRKCRSQGDEGCLSLALDDALAADPDLLEAYVNRSALRARQKQWELALSDVDQALRLDPRCAAAHANRAFVAVHRKEFAQAIASARAALRSDPSNRSAQYSMALAEINLGAVAEGFRRMEDLAVDYEPARRALILAAPQRARLEKAARSAGRAAQGFVGEQRAMPGAAAQRP